MTSQYSTDLTSLRTDIEVIKQDIKYIKNNFQEFNKVIKGDTQPGIIQKVERLEDFKNKILGALIVMNVVWGLIITLIKI